MVNIRGQGSIEYITIISAMLIVFAAFTIPQLVNPSVEAGRDSVAVGQARTTADKIADSINGVYSNAEGAKIAETVEISATWSLVLDNNVRVGVQREGEENKWWAVADLKYKFENQISENDISQGTYSVIVEWSDTMGENLFYQPENDRIHIYIKPRGGS